MTEKTSITFADGLIEDVTINKEGVFVRFAQWDNRKVTICFLDCEQVVDRNSIGRDVAKLITLSDTEELRNVKRRMIEDEQSVDNIQLLHFSFIDSWDEESILDIFAAGMQVNHID